MSDDDELIPTPEEIAAIYMALVGACSKLRAKPISVVGAIGALLMDISERPDGLPAIKLVAIIAEGFVHESGADVVDFIGVVTTMMLRHAAEDGHKESKEILAAQAAELAEPSGIVADIERGLHRRPEPVRRRFSRRPRG